MVACGGWSEDHVVGHGAVTVGTRRVQALLGSELRALACGPVVGWDRALRGTDASGDYSSWRPPPESLNAIGDAKIACFEHFWEPSGREAAPLCYPPTALSGQMQQCRQREGGAFGQDGEGERPGQGQGDQQASGATADGDQQQQPSKQGLGPWADAHRQLPASPRGDAAQAGSPAVRDRTTRTSGASPPRCAIPVGGVLAQWVHIHSSRPHPGWPG